MCFKTSIGVFPKCYLLISPTLQHCNLLACLPTTLATLPTLLYKENDIVFMENHIVFIDEL